MTDDHDPMALLGEPEPVPTVWESLAQQTQWLADLAQRAATLAPEHRISRPDGAEDDDVAETDLLADLDARWQAIRAVVAACRRETYQELREQGWSVQQIAEHWGVSDKAVYKVLGRR